MMPVSITENAREILKVINKYPLMMAKERERERESGPESEPLFSRLFC